MNLSSRGSCGKQRVFLLFKNVFDIDQYDFGLAMRSDDCLDKWT